MCGTSNRLTGYILLHRQILNWEWYGNTNTRDVFIHLLLKANFKDARWQGMEIKRGQVVIGTESLATELGLKRSQVRTALKNLQKTGEITTKTTNKFTVVTIVKWRNFQVDRTNDNQQTAVKSPTDDQQITIKSPQRKNDNKEKNSIMSSAADGVSAVDYEQVVNSFNSICTSLPKVQKLSDTRKRKIKGLVKALGNMSVDEFFTKVESSDFLSGRSGKWTSCCFDWVIKSENITKVVEGNYDNKEVNNSNSWYAVDSGATQEEIDFYNECEKKNKRMGC